MKDYGDDIKIVFKHYVVHPQTATLPAQAACAGHMQGKFSEMEKLIWTKGYDAGRNFSQDNLESMAKELGLNMDKFKADMSGPCVQKVKTDQRELAAVGARGTPAFFINGRFLSGARPIDQFKAIIDQELKKANEIIAKGTPVEKYYNEHVLKKGLKKLENK